MAEYIPVFGFEGQLIKLLFVLVLATKKVGVLLLVFKLYNGRKEGKRSH